MLDIATTSSASVHALTGSSRPGAVPPSSITTPLASQLTCPHADASTCRHVDAEVIDLAGRVVALLHRERDLWSHLSAVEKAVDTALPPRPIPAADLQPIFVREAMLDGERTTTIIEPAGWKETLRAAKAEYGVAVVEYDRHVAEVGARMGLPFIEKLASRASERLGRWGRRLAGIEPQTQAGLKAKADASQVCLKGEKLSLSGWRKDLATSISADALRIIGAEADARAEQDRQADGVLLALGRAWGASRLRIERSYDAYEAAAERFEHPEIPEALLSRDADRHGLGPYPIQDVRTDAWFFGHEKTIATLRANVRSGHASARHAEIVEAYDQWTAACVAEQDRSGLTVARIENNAATAEGREIRTRICLTPAHTAAGTDLKMQVVLWCLDGIEGLTSDLHPSQVEDPATGATLALSLVLDLARQREVATSRTSREERAA